mmetsp:Transcript_5550/g.11561  ORF Transcript_5550/g.11561 Transcript_5550/m.11561 type:complete len:94 (+) Transcript_5550:249-530(+)
MFEFVTYFVVVSDLISLLHGNLLYTMPLKTTRNYKRLSFGVFENLHMQERANPIYFLLHSLLDPTHHHQNLRRLYQLHVRRSFLAFAPQIHAE